MKTRAQRTTIAATALMMLLLADLSTARADAPMEPSPIGQMASALNPLNWRLPQWRMPSFKQMLPEKDETTRIKKKKDGLVDEVSKTASNSWSKTKEVLNPQKLNPVNYFTASSRKPAPPKQSQTKPGFFRSLFTPEPPAKQDGGTVTDFLRQPRPGP